VLKLSIRLASAGSDASTREPFTSQDKSLTRPESADLASRFGDNGPDIASFNEHGAAVQGMPSCCVGELEHRSKITVTLVVEQLKLLDRRELDNRVEVVIDIVASHTPLKDPADRRGVRVGWQAGHVDPGHAETRYDLGDVVDVFEAWVHSDHEVDGQFAEPPDPW
jgi:hypothetical protein